MDECRDELTGQFAAWLGPRLYDLLVDTARLSLEWWGTSRGTITLETWADARTLAEVNAKLRALAREWNAGPGAQFLP